jgi:hypothetical protein
MDEHCRAFLAGFTAAEGCFTQHRASSGKERFTFLISVGATDQGMCALAHELLGVGAVRHFSRRQAHYDDEVTFAVQALPELVDVIVPFMDAWLPPSHKRTQYLAWRAALLDYWEHRARRLGR